MKCIAFLFLLAGIAAHAADRSRFRGADGTGNAGDSKAPPTWSDMENLKRTAALPERNHRFRAKADPQTRRAKHTRGRLDISTLQSGDLLHRGGLGKTKAIQQTT